jgi:hypothetical protein
MSAVRNVCAGGVQSGRVKTCVGLVPVVGALQFEYPPYEPLGRLCLVVALTEYFPRRTDSGGTLRGIPGV